MRIKLTNSILVPLSLCISLSVSAKTIYVEIGGDDGNDGSQSMPFKTFQRANQVLEPGDTLLIGGGIYRQTMTINASGTEALPILIRPKDGEKVVIKGTETVTGWTQHAGNIYSANVTMDIVEHSRQVYHNNDLMQIARWPNDVDNNIFTIDAHEVTVAGTATSLNVQGIPDLDLSDGYVWYLGQHAGTSWTKQITSNTTTEISYPEININQWPYSNHNPVQRIDGGYGRFFVYGKLALLDHEREWFYDADAKKLYFQPADDNMPSDTEVEYAVRERAIEIDGNYIDIEGIDVWGANLKIDGNYNRYAKANVTHGMQRLSNPAENAGAQISDGSINIVGRFNIIEDNVIHHGSINGIHVAGWQDRGDFTVIQNNEIRYFDTLGIHASLVRSNADNVKVLKNVMSHTGRDGVYIIGINNEMAYNDVSLAAMINNDGGIFYTVGNAEDRLTSIHHNWFHDAMRRDYHDQRTAGIYLDNDSKGFLVYNNVVWNVPWSGIQLNWDNWNNHIYHNTLLNVEQAMGEWINGRTPRDNRVWNNYSSQADWLRSDAYDLKSNIISSINQFIDSANQNFIPNAVSSLVDSARIIDDVDKFSNPFVGPAPDVGAYEAGGTQWTTGINALEDVCSDCASDPNSDPVYAPVAASVTFDDRNKYLTTNYAVGSTLEASVDYDAGTGKTIADTLGGVRFALRLIDKSEGPWVTKLNIMQMDASAVGLRAGKAAAAISLEGLATTAELPENQFYYLFVNFEASDGSRKSVGVQPIQIGPDNSIPASLELLNRNFYLTNTFTTADELSVTVNYEAGTGNTVTRHNAIHGVRFFLREVTANFVPVPGKQQAINDESAIDKQTGQASATFSLKGLTPTADLPEGNFYQVFVVFRPSGATQNVTEGVIRMNIVAATMEGDLNGDNVVDMQDYTVFIGSYGRSEGDAAYIAAADMDSNGVINMLDLQHWYQVYLAQ